jgi:hypothetical protein
MSLITNIEQYKLTVRVNKSIPFDTVQIYLNDAQGKYLNYYLGASLLARLEAIQEPPTEADQTYLPVRALAVQSLGPLAEALGTHERSITTGDSGHTVARTDSLAPASEVKIKQALESLLARGWQHIEELLEYLEANAADFPEWQQSKYYRNARTHFFGSAEEFQDAGLVDIDRSRMTFEKFRQLIIRIERAEVQPAVSDEIYNSIFVELEDAEQEALRLKLLSACRAYIGSRVAELHTSTQTHQQRAQNSNTIEYRPTIRPLYADTGATGNYYAEQSRYWMSQIESVIGQLVEEPDDSGKIEWNSFHRRIFNSEG